MLYSGKEVGMHKERRRGSCRTLPVAPMTPPSVASKDVRTLSHMTKNLHKIIQQPRRSNCRTIMVLHH